MPPRTAAELQRQIEYWKKCLAENPCGQYALAMRNLIAWLENELENLRKAEKTD